VSGNEVLAVLAILSAGWPYVEITESTGRLWTEELERFHPADALAAAHQLVRNSDRFPSIAEFIRAMRPLTARRVQAEQQADYERKALIASTATGYERGAREVAIAAGVPPADVVDEIVPPPGGPVPGLWPSTKAYIASKNAMQHDHRGPDPCPVCGGVKP